MNAKKNESICMNKNEIQDYFGGISDYVFAKFIKSGMPARFEGRDWIAHKTNLDAWFRWYTRLPAQNYLNPNQSGEIHFDNDERMKDEGFKSP